MARTTGRPPLPGPAGVIQDGGPVDGVDPVPVGAGQAVQGVGVVEVGHGDPVDPVQAREALLLGAGGAFVGDAARSEEFDGVSNRLAAVEGVVTGQGEVS